VVKKGDKVVTCGKRAAQGGSLLEVKYLCTGGIDR
jgi:hypothetical protein